MSISDGECIHLLQTKIKGLYSQIGYLKTKRNCYAPVSKLSPEIMRRIFVFLRDSHFFAEDYTKQCEWISQVCHVCRSWRNIALQYPQLWSQIVFFESSKLAKMFLERSRLEPL
ncbi:hypothetical protein BJ165DRAFT_1351194, partial [Panaeolus papilionaceus]